MNDQFEGSDKPTADAAQGFLKRNQRKRKKEFSGLEEQEIKRLFNLSKEIEEMLKGVKSEEERQRLWQEFQIQYSEREGVFSVDVNIRNLPDDVRYPHLMIEDRPVTMVSLDNSPHFEDRLEIPQYNLSLSSSNLETEERLEYEFSIFQDGNFRRDRDEQYAPEEGSDIMRYRGETTRVVDVPTLYTAGAALGIIRSRLGEALTREG